MTHLALRLLSLAVLITAGCTPVPESLAQSAADAGADGSAADGSENASNVATGGGARAMGERCEGELKLRCGTGREREVCQGGFWIPTVECGDGEVCTESGAGVRCLGVANICRGNAGMTVCDGKGVLYRCGDDGVSQSSEVCPSVRHCQLGLAAKGCAACVPGEFRCEGDMLQRCDADGQAFSTSESCAADSCDAAGGRCKGAPCPETRWRCRGDMLQKCQQGESEYRDAESCGPNLCDAIARACNRCVPGLGSCASDIAITCAADGASQTSVDCAKDATHCVGAGRCLRCARDADCDDPGACMRAYCNLAQGRCEPQPRAAGTSCPQGVCAADGTCGSCLADADCAAPAECEVRHCDPASHGCMPRPAAKGTSCSGGKCDGAGHCATCSVDGDCPEAPACQVRHCDASSHVCDPRPVADGSACDGAFGDGKCLSGRCVQCTNDASCPSSGDCQEGVCRSSDNTCQTRPKASGASCGGDQVCDGSGRCVQCAAPAHCGANATCSSNTCHCNDGYVANPTGKGCNFDECAKFDDNRCGVTDGGNTCTNTASGYDCGCVAPWQKGQGQCFKRGSRTVKNGMSWNVLPEFAVVCENAFDSMNPCATRAQLSWLSVCGLPNTDPGNCSEIRTNPEGLAGVTALRVNYSGPLEQYGDPPTDGVTDYVGDVQLGNVILFDSAATLYIMRITALDGAAMTYEWAELYRDTCWRPGGALCTAACNCPGGN